MQYTLFGRTGLRVSELSLGAMTIGEDWGWGADKETSARIVDAYADAGGNFIDTANNYTNGSSETILGELLEGRRDRFVLATKYSCATRTGDVNAAGNHRKNLVQSVESSLARLRTDRIDVLWVHARDNFTPVEEVMRALDDLVRSGKVLYLGVSDWAAWEIAQASTMAELRGWTPFAGSQLRYNLLERTPERELLPQAAPSTRQCWRGARSPQASSPGSTAAAKRAGWTRPPSTPGPIAGRRRSSPRCWRSPNRAAGARRRWRWRGCAGGPGTSSRSSPPPG